MLLVSPESDGPIAENSRENVELLSLKISLFSLSYFTICSFPLTQIGWVNLVKRIVLSCNMSTFHWLIGLPLSSYPPTLDFHPIRRCHMSTWAPLDSPCLTNSAPDTRHTVSHSKYAKCPALRSFPRKMCKLRLSRNLTKFDVVARFRKTIPTVKFVSSSKI